MKSAEHWKKIGLHSHHGISIPLFSLRTKKSSGIGEFLDLIPLIDWCKSVGFDCIQLLPLNDSGYDPSPYNPLSSCALDPIYLSLPTPHLQELNELPRLSRHLVKEKKLALFYQEFQRTFATLSKTAAYRQFVPDNPWLAPYAKYLKGEADFHYFLQFHCFTQMEKVHAYAKKHKILLKGDLPILISSHSADLEAHPELFNCHYAAGAPPDLYNPEGQKWGFPLFHWDAMRKEHFAWYRERLKTAEHLYDIYRIDHVLGLFRIWAIPLDGLPEEGFYIPEERALWEPQGKELLSMLLGNSTMLPMAEDLGVVPDVVPPTLRALGICGTKVMRWERYFKGHWEYTPISHYEPFSMTTLTTHDLPPLADWWKLFPEESHAFCKLFCFRYEKELSFEMRKEILSASHKTTSYFHINPLQEYLALFPSLTYEEERINAPDNPRAPNWTWRMRPYLEELLEHTDLCEALQQILSR